MSILVTNVGCRCNPGHEQSSSSPELSAWLREEEEKEQECDEEHIGAEKCKSIISTVPFSTSAGQK